MPTPRPDTRIYLVTDKKADAKRLVRAPNNAQAIRHCAKDFSATVASQDELIAAVGAGVKVEEAKASTDFES
jgi:hypothetical protein